MSVYTCLQNSFDVTNLWLKNVDFIPSENGEVSCNKTLKTKYNILRPAKFQPSTSNPNSSPSSLKRPESISGNSKIVFNATFPELEPSVQINGVKHQNGAAHTGSGDSSKSHVIKASNTASTQSEIPKPKYIIDNPDNVVLEWTSFKSMGPGLTNLGNTCFMNSVIQCLTYCPPFVNSLMRGNHGKCNFQNTCMACIFQEHFSRVFRGGGGVVAPKNFAQKLKLLSKSFNWGSQEDAHEYLRYVIDNMCRHAVRSAEYERNKSSGIGAAFKFDPRSKETTIFNHIFGGYLRSQITCLTCKSTSNTYDHFMDLMLEIKGVDSLERALEKFTSSERLEDENSYKCTGCKKKSDATKKFTIHSPPNVLTIQLKRFDTNRFFGKINRHINFTQELDLKRFMSNQSTPDVTYRLFAVLVHDGNTCRSGHYYCYVKSSSEMWYQMNDSAVIRSFPDRVLAQNAYILFYVRKSKSKLNGLHTNVDQSNQLMNSTNTNCPKPLASVNGTKQLISNRPGLLSYGSSQKIIAQTSTKFIGPNFPKKPFLSDPAASPVKNTYPNNLIKSNSTASSIVVVKPGGNKPAVIEEKPRSNNNNTNGPKHVLSTSQTPLNAPSRSESNKRLVEYSDGSESDEPISKKVKSSSSNGIKIFSNLSSSNSVSSLSDRSSHSSRDNTPPSKDGKSHLPLNSSVPVMNGSNTVITKDIVHKSSSFDAEKINNSLQSFGPDVKSWSGSLNSIDVKVDNDKRDEEEANREEEEYNREFDVGKTKKVKSNGRTPFGEGLLYHGNPFDQPRKEIRSMNRTNNNNSNYYKKGPFKTHRNGNNRSVSFDRFSGNRFPNKYHKRKGFNRNNSR